MNRRDIFRALIAVPAAAVAAKVALGAPEKSALADEFDRFLARNAEDLGAGYYSYEFSFWSHSGNRHHAAFGPFNKPVRLVAQESSVLSLPPR